MGTKTETGYEPAAHYDHVHGAWRLIMGDEFHYGYFATAETPLESADGRPDRPDAGPGPDRAPASGSSTSDAAPVARRVTWPATLGATVLGITTSASGVAAATQLAVERGPATMPASRSATAPTTGSTDASFDVVWVLESSHLMRDRAALLRGVHPCPGAGRTAGALRHHPQA